MKALFLSLLTLAAATAVVAAVNACATVQVTGPVPQDAGLTGPCGSGVSVQCDAGPPGSVGCTSDPDAGYYQGLIPAQSFPLGCAVNFPDPKPIKNTGECALYAQCTCTGPGGPSGKQWTCVR